ncbi:MAG: metal ABC transporter substrate-binding protein [Acetatifactor sp.]|nr:metal ABC transporter substrate-binding protein [Acetatifactor sp.]
MKKIIALLLTAVLLTGCLSACGNTTSAGSFEDDNSIQIVTTIFPEYDWVRELLGSKITDADITLLLDNGVDLHSYQPTAEDILKIAACDLFIYVGGESDEWVEDALLEATNKNMVVVNLLDALGDSVKPEEIVEGMESDEHEHEHDNDEHDHEEEIEYDEHVWLSLKNAQVLCDVITDALIHVDPENSETYRQNLKTYQAELIQLDEEYQQAIDSASTQTLLFGDRFPFRYLVDDYQLSYYAAFAGCSAETEASFETVSFLSAKVDELKLPCVLTIEGADHKLAETIIQNTSGKNQKLLTLDSLQSTTSQDINEGVTYLTVMENNLNILKEALN